MCDDCDDCCDCDMDCYCCDNDQHALITTVSGTFCFILSMLFMTMFPLSVLVLNPLKVGLLYDHNSMQVDTDKLWHPGRYWVGLSREFLEFPVYRRIILFSDTIPVERLNKTGASFSETSLVNPSINARTIEGMSVNLSIMLGYTLGTATDADEWRDQLWDLYQKFGMDWDKFIRIVVQAEVRNVIALYRVQQFSLKRLEIETTIFEHIRDYLKDFHISVKTLYIMNFDFAEGYRFSIKDTQVAIQEIQEAEFNKATIEVQSDTKVTLSKIDKEIIVATATANAEATYLAKEAQSLAIVKRLAAYKTAIRYAQTKLLFTGTPQAINDAILDMMYAYLLQYGESSSKIIQSLNYPTTLNSAV